MNQLYYNNLKDYYKKYYDDLEKYCLTTRQFFKEKISIVEIESVLKVNDLPYIIDLSKNNNPLLAFLSDKNKNFYNKKLLNKEKGIITINKYLHSIINILTKENDKSKEFNYHQINKDYPDNNNIQIINILEKYEKFLYKNLFVEKNIFFQNLFLNVNNIISAEKIDSNNFFMQIHFILKEYIRNYLMYHYFQLMENCLFKSNEWEYINLVYIEKDNIKEYLSQPLKFLSEIENSNSINFQENFHKKTKIIQNNDAVLKITDWKDLSFTFRDNRIFEIYDRKNETSINRSFSELNFENKKNKKELLSWTILLLFCQNKGILNYDLICKTCQKYYIELNVNKFKDNAYFRKQIQLLNKKLKEYFKFADNPINLEKSKFINPNSNKTYKTIFSIQGNPFFK